MVKSVTQTSGQQFSSRQRLGYLRDWLIPLFIAKGNRKLRFRIMLALGCLVLAKVVAVTFPLFFKQLIDGLQPPDINFTSAPIALLLAICSARILSVLLNELREHLFFPVGKLFVRELGTKLLAHLHKLSYEFHIHKRSGSLGRVLERGIRAIEQLLFFLMFSALPSLLEVLLVSVVLASIFGASYAIIAGVAIVIYFILTILISEWRMKFRRKMNQADSLAIGRAVESVSNFETVKLFTAEDNEVTRLRNALVEIEKPAYQGIASLSLLNIAQALILGLTQFALLLLATSQYLAGNFSMGSLVLIQTYMLQLFAPLNFLGTTFRNLRQAVTDLDAMIELLLQPPALQDTGSRRLPRRHPQSIEFRDVHFAFAEAPILRGVSFRAEIGQKIAIVGESGAGKSTITRLLTRMLTPTSGAILVGEQDITTVTVKSLRQAIAVVPQDCIMFNESLTFNIRYGLPQATMRAVRAAAKTAQLDRYISSLPLGYNTLVGERGLRLSGGERQRLAIARAVIQQPGILVFDEATSSLDTRTEKQIQTTLDSITHGHTCMFIAHRLSTIINCELIIVLQQGKVIEHGNHNQLLRLGGHYAELWTKQLKSGSAVPA